MKMRVGVNTNTHIKAKVLSSSQGVSLCKYVENLIEKDAEKVKGVTFEPKEKTPNSKC